MTVDFQIPYCARCERRGASVEPTRYWTVVHRGAFQKSGHSFAAVLRDKDTAARWGEYVKRVRGLDALLLSITYAKCSKGEIEWAKSDYKPLQGALVADLAVYATEALAEKNRWVTTIRMVVAP